ncbi:hypothetical protein GR925_37855 [Streptomyces sp. HUCO-GS316]|uniref:hypothetical protein n=1 Tax=Streptomyces sp. HUCO-GS316 TaxID=2692198 RepID=UPI00136D058F|nr:hypothetical protein [Streptomyces sp. HUCO-GS316]MXM69006.1 hypothetical protein [Streptomyces sp. HUCO-GS316]
MRTVGAHKTSGGTGGLYGDGKVLRDGRKPEVAFFCGGFNNDALFWHGLEDTTGVVSGLPERPCPWDADLLLWCPPDHVPLIAAWWRQAAPQLDVLREPFTQHATESGGWITTFESFADFLTDWGEVVTEAERRGWGIIGLRC